MSDSVNADALSEVKVTEAQVEADATTEVKAPTVEELLAKSAKDAELIEKLRKFERENKGLAYKAKMEAEALAIEQGKWKELYEAQVEKLSQLETRQRDAIVNAALKEALKEAGVKAESTVLKLIDKKAISVDDDVVDTASIKAQIEALKLSDPILFTKEREGKAATVARAAEGTPVGGYQKEMKACRNQAEIEAVMAKYSIQ